MVKRILQYFRRETVLSAALICALLSFLLTPPSVIHLQGIDTTTLLMLFSLMTIVAGFRRMGALGQKAAAADNYFCAVRVLQRNIRHGIARHSSSPHLLQAARWASFRGGQNSRMQSFALG